MIQQVVRVFKALSDETRIEIVRLLLEKKELSCRELLEKFSLAQPTLSHHFSKLADADILKIRKEGTHNFYSINKQYLKKLGVNLQKITEM